MGEVLNIRRAQPVGDEPDLIDACRRGDRAALGQVFTTHAPYLERLLGRMCGSPDQVQDTLQCTYVAAMRAFPGFRGEAAVRTWLARIAVRTVQAQRRRPEARRRSPLELIAERTHDERGVDPERQWAGRERIERIQQHLQAIAPKKRVAFVLHVLEGHPMDEVAAMVGASRPATKSRVFWARRELMQRMRKDPGLRDLFADRDAP